MEEILESSWTFPLLSLPSPICDWELTICPCKCPQFIPSQNNLVLLSTSHLNCCKYHELVFLSPVSSVPSLSSAYFQHLMILLSASAVLSHSVMSDSATPWTVACQTPCPWGFSRQEYWSGLPCPPPGDLLIPGIKPRSPTLLTDSLPSEPPGKLSACPTLIEKLQYPCKVQTFPLECCPPPTRLLFHGLPSPYSFLSSPVIFISLSLSPWESYCPILPWYLGTIYSSPRTRLSSPSDPKGTQRLPNSSRSHKFPFLSDFYQEYFVFRLFFELLTTRIQTKDNLHVVSPPCCLA